MLKGRWGVGIYFCVSQVASPNQSPGRARFGSFELDLRTGELKRDGRQVRLQGQPAQFLVLLVCQPGELITREDLRAKLWPEDTFVDFDHGLKQRREPHSRGAG